MTLSSWHTLAFLVSGGAATLVTLPAYGLPAGGSVVTGEASIESVSPNQLEIHQASDRAILHWETFSISPEGQVIFHQPSVDASTLNRVTGSTPSNIAGQITAQGTVMLVNPNGIVFTPTAQVDVGSLVVSTLDIQDRDFLEGHYRFEAQPGEVPAGIENHGNITVAEGGMAAFIAPTVANRGVIAARLGTVVMAAGQGVTLDLVGDGFLQIQVDPLLAQELTDVYGNPLSALVSQSGEVLADGGQVILSAAMVERLTDSILGMDGVIQANRVENQEGRIVLRGDGPGAVNIAGKIEAEGGRLEVSAQELTVESEIGTPRWSGSGAADMAVALELGSEAEAGRLTVSEDGFLRVRELEIDSPYRAEAVEASVVIDNAREDGLHGETLSLNTRLDIENFGFNPSNRVNVNAGSSIQDGVNAVADGGFVAIGAGRFTEGNTTSINRSLTIAGAGDGADPGSNTIISGENSYAVFDISSGAIRFDGLRITDGRAPAGGSGGGMRIQSGAVVNVTNSVFANNTADTGGAIDNDGTLSLIRTLLTGNTAQGLGGAIRNSRDILVDNSRLSDNSASSGGGVYNSGFAIANNTSISENTATGDGGGLANSGRITINRSTIANNQARVGGGIDNMPSGLAEIFNSTISSNTASEIGGGINNSRTMGIVNSTLSGNEAGLFGGGISNLGQIGQSRGDLLLINTLISGNAATPTLESIDRNLPRLIGIDPPYDFGTDDPTTQSGAEIANLGWIQFQGGNLLGSNGNNGFTQDFSILFTAAPLFSIFPGQSSGSFTTPNVPTSQIITDLGSFGGVTQTHNLVPGSPAINAGTAATATAALNALTAEPSPATTGFIGGSLSYKITEELLAPLNRLIFLESILEQNGRILNQEWASLSAGEVYDAYLALNAEFSDLVSRDEYIRDLDQLSSQATDQRGAPRPVGGAFDIGAVEFGSTAPPIPQPPAAPTPPPPPPVTPPTTDGGTPQAPGSFSQLPDSAFSDLYRQRQPNQGQRDFAYWTRAIYTRNWRAWQGMGMPGRNDSRYQLVTDRYGSFNVGVAPHDFRDGGKVNLLDRPIEPRRQTTFYTHGWNSDHQGSHSNLFATDLGLASVRGGAVDQRIMVDWGQGAKTSPAGRSRALRAITSPQPLREELRELQSAARRIPTVAEALALRILESGLKPEEVDLVGHSLGSYVSVEAARILYQRYDFAVNSVTLLDPANVELIGYEPPSLSLLSEKNTSTLAIYDLAYGGGNPANNGEYARRANRSIGLSGGRNPVAGHDAPIELYGSLLKDNTAQTIDDLRQGTRPFDQIFPGASFIPGSPTRSHVQIYW